MKCVRLAITLVDIDWTPVTIEAASSPPGRLGIETLGPVPLLVGIDVVLEGADGRNVGS